MAKNVFRPTEVTRGENKIYIKPPEIFSRKMVAEVEEIEEVEEYTGPTADDLRKEAELFRANFEKEKETMNRAAKTDADRIVKEADSAAYDLVRKKTEEAAQLRKAAEDEAALIVAEAKKKAEIIIEESRREAMKIEDEEKKKGYTEGRDAGWKEGKAEADRLVERLHFVLAKAIEKRSDIINQSEAQIVHLILQIAKKVVKVISENQKNIVINNALQALKKLKNKSDVTIRVNLLDVNLMTEHAQDVVDMIENVKSVTVLEDATVDRGGCIIETDFGEIDARIAAQLREIEERILELVPIQSKDT